MHRSSVGTNRTKQNGRNKWNNPAARINKPRWAMSNYIQSGELTASRIDGNKSLLKCSGKARNEIPPCAGAGEPAG